MHRIDTPNREQDKFGTGKDGFTEGSVATGTPPTETSDDIFDAFQEELCGVVEETASLVKTDNTQLLTSIRSMAASNAVRNWETKTPGSAFAGDLRGVCWGADPYSNEAYCAVGVSGEIQLSEDGGHTWTQQAEAGAPLGTDFNAVCHNGELFVVVGDSGVIQVSTGGGSWASRSPGSGFAGDFYGVASDTSGNLIAVGASAGGVAEIQRSTDNGATWVQQAEAGAPLSAIFRGVVFADGLWVIVGDNAVQTSPDGTTWTARTPAHANSSYNVAWNTAGELFVAVGGSSAELQTSPDGITWTSRTSNGIGDIYGVASCQLLTLAGGDDGVAPGGMIFSYDGETWYPIRQVRSEIYSVACNEVESFVAVGESGYIGLSQKVNLT